jgi:hypothetical protein
MAKTRLLRSSFFALASLVITACASGGGGGETQTQAPAQPTGNTISIRVTNDIVPPTSITVWMVPEQGSRRRLGTLEPNGQGTYTFSPGIRSMEHRLTAEKTGGGSASTNPFTLEGVTGVRWAASSTVATLDR